MNYERILATVRRLIDATGRSVTFEALSATPADTTRPWRGPAAPVAAASVVTKATFVPPASADFGKEFISDELLKRCSQVCLVAPSASFDMDTCTSILDGGVRWSVEWAQALRPGDTALLYAMGVRR